MNRPIPLWFFLLCLLVGTLATVAFGWAVKATISGSDRPGVLGEVAVKIASFPNMVNDVFLEISGFVSGSYKDDEPHRP